MSPTIKPAPVRKTLIVRASPETAFRVFTADFDRWWPRSHHIGKTPMVRAVIEPRAGGRWYEIGDDGQECDWGDVLAWEPPAPDGEGGRLLLAWRLDPEWGFDPNLLTEVEVRFTPTGGGHTRIDFEHRGFERMGARGEVARGRVDSPNGWTAILAKFKSSIEQPEEATMIVIHTVPGSPFARVAMLACEEKGVPWRIEALAPGQHKGAEHLKRHPFGRMPAIEHDGFWLYEAQAIARYIDAAFGGPSLTPTDPKQIARMSQVMNIMDWYAFPSLTAGIGFHRVVAPALGLPVNEDAVKAALEPGALCLRALEEILGSQPYFAGEAVTLADLVAVAHLEMIAGTPEGAELLAGSPLLGWLERMAERPSVQKTEIVKIMTEARAAASAAG